MASGVPKTTQVVPGAPVNIVLKADQRTGRQVTGVVRDVLTRGDHHRGIKVRLADGRIGRVQSMASQAGPGGGPTEAAAPVPAESGTSQPRSRGAGRFQHRYEDARFDGYSEPPQEQTDLAAYIVAPKKKGKGRKPAPAAAAAAACDGTAEAAPAAAAVPAADVASANATCPVCGAFEGDETAVAHHVATHFE